METKEPDSVAHVRIAIPRVRSPNQRDFVFGPRRPRHTRNATIATATPTSAPTTRNRDPNGAPDAERTWMDNVPIVDCPATSRALTCTTWEPSVSFSKTDVAIPTEKKAPSSTRTSYPAIPESLSVAP